MINLIPPSQIERLKDQGRLILTWVLGLLFLSFLLSTFLFLYLANVYISSDLETQKLILEERNKTISLNHETEKEITESNKLLSDLKSFYSDNIKLTQFFEKINEIMPNGMYLTDFNFMLVRQRGEKKVTVSLSGYSPDRNELLNFKENLEKTENVSDVHFSPASWIKPSEIDFSVNFKLN